MSNLEALPTLLDVRRGDTTLSVSVRLPNGEVEKWVFGRGEQSPAENRIEQISHSLNGEPGVFESVSFMVRNKQGKVVPISVETDDLDKFLPQLYPPDRYALLTAIRYGDDHITLEYDDPDTGPQTFTFGVRNYRYEHTLFEYGATWRDRDIDFTRRFYRVSDRKGWKYWFEVLIPAGTVRQFSVEQADYFKALDEGREPEPKMVTFKWSDEARKGATSPKPNFPGPLRIEQAPGHADRDAGQTA